MEDEEPKSEVDIIMIGNKVLEKPQYVKNL